MVSSVRPVVLRWVLLCGLAFCLVGMHSLVAADADMGHAPTTSTSTAAMLIAAADEVGMSCCGGDHRLAAGQPGHAPGHGHDMQHLCLAVLVAVAGLIVAWLLWRRGHTAERHHEPRPTLVPVGRGPPLKLRTGDLLSSLCVLRL
jgi:hypothetical protein